MYREQYGEYAYWVLGVKGEKVSLLWSHLFSVPRVLFDQWTFNDYHIIFSSDTALQSLIDTIVSYLKVSEGCNAHKELCFNGCIPCSELKGFGLVSLVL